MALYIDGLFMGDFKHIPEISSYNRNYYVGFNQDLLFCKSDDDRTDEWWLIKACSTNICLGETDSYEQKLHK